MSLDVYLPNTYLPDAIVGPTAGETTDQRMMSLAKAMQDFVDALRAGQQQRNVVAAGGITDTGAVGSRSGAAFTAARNGLGDFTVNFTNPLPATPIVVVSVAQNNINAGMMLHPGRTYDATTFSVVIYNAPGSASEDAPWNFIAMI